MRPAGAWNESNIDLRQTHLGLATGCTGRRRTYAVVTRQGQLQPPTQTGTAYRRDDWFGRIFNQVAQIHEAGDDLVANGGGLSDLRGGEGEFPYIGTGGKVGAGAC